MEQEVLTQVIVAALIGYGLEAVKRSAALPTLTVATTRLNRLVAALLAAAATLGIHFTFDAQAGTLLVTGLTLAGIQHVVWEYARQLVLQQLIYDGAIQRKEIS